MCLGLAGDVGRFVGRSSALGQSDVVRAGEGVGDATGLDLVDGVSGSDAGAGPTVDPEAMVGGGAIGRVAALVPTVAPRGI